MMDNESGEEKRFTTCLETFRNYTGICNSIQLALHGYHHIGNNIISCIGCKRLFITWNSDETYWQKHKLSVCSHLLDMYRASVEPVTEAMIEKWRKKNALILIKQANNFTDDLMDKLITEYLSYKGKYATLRTFNEFINFVKNFRKDLL